MFAKRRRRPLRQQREADITELQLTNWETLFILGAKWEKIKWSPSHLAISGLERPYPRVKATQGRAAR